MKKILITISIIILSLNILNADISFEEANIITSKEGYEGWKVISVLPNDYSLKFIIKIAEGGYLVYSDQFID